MPIWIDALRARARGRVMLGAVAAIASLIGMRDASAHHSDAEFDIGNCVSLSGTVRTLEWVYPHTWLWLYAPGKDGPETVWGFEFPSPTQTINLDKKWSRTAVAKGDRVTVSYSPLKDGRPGGWMHSVTRADGSILAGAPGRCERSVPIAPSS